ncbi:MAG TPA: M20/M25/M40 family metallo-hydrolase, partial [Planctomycetota bacterium]|nr:M20/M25/M40 family metallo-hydrolase [Planctomycetota bacterium]
MRLFLPLALAALSALPAAAPARPPAGPQDDKKSEELLRKIDQALEAERERLRGELLDIVRQELKGPAPAPRPRAPDRAPAPPAPPAAPPAPAAAGNVEKAKAAVTTDLLKKHAYFLADDALEGRCAGYPGCNKAADYIAEVMKQAGLAPAGDEGTYFQKFRVKGRETKNCVGILEGTDPDLKKEFVVIGAHYDHVGTSEQDDFGRLGAGSEHSIWNGADDNGSGTTTVLGVLRAFAEGGLRTRRTIVFILFSGEEAGLIGSRYYCNHPAGPISQHVYMLNLDMVGRNPQKPIEVQGVGSAEGAVLQKIVERACEKNGLKAKITPQVTLMGG